ncbi:methyltransferase domain-containing protein [Caballeronia insecticola]|uniref:Methyltransferase type 11 n=1 Tax=Caballeronia insecticola TaxID=758793 RepID=R4X0K2_9BURK|nr:methyltransferase type 11 [Caballeronia insecticola]BAN24467.1 methyltransferase type 11 [Caballeronia insecticola]
MEAAIKTAERRARDPEFVQRYLAGAGLDFAPDASHFRPLSHLFPKVSKVLWWNTSLGGEIYMNGVDDISLDFVHADFCLAAQHDPVQALSRWLDLLKPGGHAIVTVPNEHGDATHKWSFSIGGASSASLPCIDMLEVVKKLGHVAQCERLAVIRDDRANEAADESADESADASAESIIELVLRKRQVRSMSECVKAIFTVKSAEACVAACYTAIETYPYRSDVHLVAVQHLLRWRELSHMDVVVERAVETMPHENQALLSRAYHQISVGRLKAGFTQREQIAKRMRWQRRTKAEPPQDTPAWKGEPLAGKRIVIWSEFGLGDEIFFFRFARILRERAGAASVSVVCQSPLTKLFEASGEADAIIDVKDAGSIPPHDFWVYPHAIPAHLPLDLDALPPSIPYLRAPDVPAPGMEQLDARAVKVGIVFKGDPTHENDASRSLPSLSVLDSLFAIEGAEFYSLQKGAGADEAADYAERLPNFHDIGAHVTTMEQTASAIMALDVVVTVDTSVAHVAGALGTPVWLMLPSYGDWRWHYIREDSPWYPSMRLLRTEWGDDWTKVVARIGAWLGEWSEARRR